MERVCKHHFGPWHDLILHRSDFCSIFKQQVGVVLSFSFSISNLSLTCSIINHEVNKVKYASLVDKENNDSQQVLNQVSHPFPPSFLEGNSYHFSNSIDVWMEEIC